MRIWLIAACLAMLPSSAAAQAPALSARNPQAVGIIRELRRIVSPQGLQAIEMVPIGGIRQAMSIRSQDLRNPVLIYFHGGPGFPEMPLDWWWGRGWDEYFTVIHWDQRDAGKTYAASGPSKPADLTPQRYQRDAEEVVQWARKRFGKQRIFVLGHSWGSVLGLRLAAEHPDWLHAYIGMGQLTDGLESERRGWAWALTQAKADGNATAIAELEKLAPYAADIPPTDAILMQRKWLQHYGGAAWRRTGGGFEAAAIALAPEYTDKDVKEAFAGQPAVTRAMLSSVLAVDLSAITRLETPLVLLLGRHDRSVSSEVASEWFDRLRAPAKHRIWFERSAHHVTSEEPGRLLNTLISVARPIAARAGDVAPD